MNTRKRNPVARVANTFNRCRTHRDRKAAAKRGYTKHKARRYEPSLTDPSALSLAGDRFEENDHARCNFHRCESAAQ